MFETHPDWAPSLNLGHSEVKETNGDRYPRRRKRSATTSALNIAVSAVVEPASEDFPAKISETEMKSFLMKKRRKQRQQMTSSEATVLQDLTSKSTHDSSKARRQQMTSSEATVKQDLTSKSTHDPSKARRQRFICSKHFAGGNRPTELNPGPLPANYKKEQPKKQNCSTKQTKKCRSSLVVPVVQNSYKKSAGNLTMKQKKKTKSTKRKRKIQSSPVPTLVEPMVQDSYEESISDVTIKTEAFETEEQGQKSSISVTDDCIVKQWQMVGTLEKLTEDNNIARFLLNFYFSSEHQSNGKPKPIIHCAFCQSSLLPVWSCRSCLKQFSFANSGNYQRCRDPRLQELSAAGEKPSIFPEAEVKKESFLSEEAEVFQKLADSALAAVSDSQNASPVQTNSDGDEGMLEKVRHETDLPVKQNTCIMPAADKTNANQLQSHAFNVVQVGTSLGLKVAQNFTINKNSEPVLNVQGIPNVQNIQSNNISQFSSVKSVSFLPFNIKSVQKQTTSITAASTQSDSENGALTSCASEKKEKETESLLSQSAKFPQRFPASVKVFDQNNTGLVVNMPKIFYLSQMNAVPSDVKTNVSKPVSNKVLLPSDVNPNVPNPVSNKVLLQSDVKTNVSNVATTMLRHLLSDDSLVQDRASDTLKNAVDKPIPVNVYQVSPSVCKVLLPSGVKTGQFKSLPNKILLPSDVTTYESSPVSNKVLLPSDVKTNVSNPVSNVVTSTIQQHLLSDDSLVQHRTSDALPLGTGFGLTTVKAKKDQASIQRNLQKRGQNWISRKAELNSKILRNFQSSRIPCNLCFKSFYSHQTLQAHILTKHKEVKEHDLFCEICKTFFKNLNTLSTHLRRHKNNTRYLCQHCGKILSSVIGMKNHENVHLGLRPYACKDCGKSFVRESNLRSHRLTHTQVKKFICDQCGKAFAWAFNMRNHRKSHGKQKVKAKS